MKFVIRCLCNNINGIRKTESFTNRTKIRNKISIESEYIQKYKNMLLTSVHLVLVCIFALILATGQVGNILNMIVFTRKSMRKLSCFRLLMYLSLVDMLVLFFGGIDAFFKYGLNMKINWNFRFANNLQTFLIYFLSQMSSLILMVN
jgi:hypothetical protein